MQVIRRRHVAQVKYDSEIAGINTQMDDDGERLVAERNALSDHLDRALDKTSLYKKLYTQSQDKLRRSIECFGELQVKLRWEQANVADQSSKRARFRRILLDPDSVLS